MDEKFSTPHLYSALRLSITTRDRYNPFTKATFSGTGFLVDTRECRYLVTNRHVVDTTYGAKSTSDKYLTHELESVLIEGYFQQPRDHSDEPIQTRFEITDPIPSYAHSTDVDIAVIPLPKDIVAPRFNSIRIPTFANQSHIADGRLYTGAPLLIPGYPGLGGQTSARPILVSGSVASDPRYSASLGGKDFPHRVLCHSFSRAGMSGAPVFGTLTPTTDWTGEPVGEELALLGVNTGHIDMAGEPSVLSLFVPAPSILSIIANTGDADAADWIGIHRIGVRGTDESIWTPPLAP